MSAIVDKIKLPKDKDRRRKITDEQRQEIKDLYKSGLAVRKIARHFEGVCLRSLIRYIVMPEKYKRQQKLFKIRQADGRYYNKNRHNNQSKNLREYKRKIFNLKTYKHPSEVTAKDKIKIDKLINYN